MAYGNRQPRINTDRFGRAYQLKTALEVVKRDGEVISGHFACHVELGGKLYKIEISERQKEHKSGRAGMWVKVTKAEQKARQTSM